MNSNWHSLEHYSSAFGWFQFTKEHMKIIGLYVVLVSSLTGAWIYSATVQNEKKKLLPPKPTKHFKISYKGHEISWEKE